jgi:hypothetical protein
MHTGAAVQPHASTVLRCDHPEAIVLDLVQPLAAGRQFIEVLLEEREIIRQLVVSATGPFIAAKAAAKLVAKTPKEDAA